MSIVVEFVGGPYDGKAWELSDPGPVCIPVLADVEYALSEDMEREMVLPIITLQPTLTRNGWRLFWPATVES